MSNIFYIHLFKKLFFFLFFSFIFSSVFSQSDIIYFEQFNQKSSLWTEYKANKNGAKILNGVYEIKSTKNMALREFFAQIFIDYKKDFSIEAKMRQISGKHNQGYGITWGAKGWQNSFIFLITSSGYFSVGAYDNGRYIKIRKWTKCPAIKPIKNYNILKICKSGRNIIFSVNGKNVFSFYAYKFFGQLQGFAIQSNMLCQVDYLKIKNSLPKVDIADINFEGIKKNIGSNINTPATEIAPIISADGKTLYFARGNSSTNPGGKKDEADIWYSKKMPDGSWSKAKNIGYPLNNSGVNVVVNVMPDGNTLYLEGLYNSDGSFKSDQGISVSHKNKNGSWSVPKQVKIDNFYNLNKYETYFFTSDQKVLLLSIERKDTYGDLDLYVSFRRPDGSYTKPKNMGPDINTFADEGTPFLAADGKTLYFSTSGLQGFGSDDIYMSKRLDDTWTHWSKPKNLGKAINSSDWDTYFSLSAKGDTAFLVSTSNSYGNEDIFTIALSKKLQPDNVVIIYGKVLDKDSKKPISASISYEDLTNGENLGIAHSNPQTGEYKIVLPYGKDYGFRAYAKGFIATSNNINLTAKAQYKEIHKNLYLSKIKVGDIIVLNNVFFTKGSSKLLKTSFSELNRVVKIMKDNPKMKIQLRGHTDNRGNPLILLRLSEDRVNVVKKYLVDNGIDSSRISTKAFGGSMPINKNDSEAEHAKNRRVEFKILKIK